ncbi:MAG: alpha/beta hydrolase [Anaerolineales bacterium]|nr:alpha/beta hydrolase [Anaerolineales bacterium]
MIEAQRITIQNIPALIWGAPSESVYVFVHGKMSKKEEAEGVAEIAVKKNMQVLSFDLPEHGERKAEGRACSVQNGVEDLTQVMEYVKCHWKTVGLFASSLGAYFSLVAYRDIPFQKCLFLSPILDMEALIHNMMQWFNVSEKELEEQQEIETSMGEKLIWDYYQFVRQNPVEAWNVETYILYGERDHLTPRTVLDAFVSRFQCYVDIVKDGEHYFHTDKQRERLRRWIGKNL